MHPSTSASVFTWMFEGRTVGLLLMLDLAGTLLRHCEPSVATEIGFSLRE
jgi:hypothetical protein